jgi:hypothetical protein
MRVCVRARVFVRASRRKAANKVPGETRSGVNLMARSGEVDVWRCLAICRGSMRSAKPCREGARRSKPFYSCCDWFKLNYCNRFFTILYCFTFLAIFCFCDHVGDDAISANTLQMGGILLASKLFPQCPFYMIAQMVCFPVYCVNAYAESMYINFDICIDLIPSTEGTTETWTGRGITKLSLPSPTLISF